jgi:PKD repeat protein
MAPFDPPVAAFVPSSTTGLAPLTVSFQDVSDLTSGPGASITSRTWDFGDGTPAETYATATNPVHIFALPSMPGQYTVTLTVVGMGGGMDSTSALTQRRRLEDEGIVFLNGRVDLTRYRWQTGA